MRGEGSIPELVPFSLDPARQLEQSRGNKIGTNSSAWGYRRSPAGPAMATVDPGGRQPKGFGGHMIVVKALRDMEDILMLNAHLMKNLERPPKHPLIGFVRTHLFRGHNAIEFDLELRVGPCE